MNHAGEPVAFEQCLASDRSIGSICTEHRVRVDDRASARTGICAIGCDRHGAGDCWNVRIKARVIVLRVGREHAIWSAVCIRSDRAHGFTLLFKNCRVRRLQRIYRTKSRDVQSKRARIHSHKSTAASRIAPPIKSNGVRFVPDTAAAFTTEFKSFVTVDAAGSGTTFGSFKIGSR